ncbi:hypothetical protein CH373_07705 [Leptospira perolatii]|uniref:Outer membrane protein beta-barrel domain-containing protein n=1 Tax=Leptospira perolatii TaxID=2023191 RepID=A0A2M9ZPJ9_9LEPT|nr:hypothetical protein [Leptospira perolatii]PJZ70789.1 hypothetical protein CH360_04565 [Leptospira perolatii]PJZ73997.1 hypothetical protein CH373_07705 [Leptospira perolatii]
MIPKYIAVILSGLLMTSQFIHAQERSSGNVETSNWSIQYGFGAGEGTYRPKSTNSSASLIPYLYASPASPANSNLLNLLYLNSGEKTEFQGPSRHYRFSAEYLPGNIGFQFGMSGASYQLIKQQADFDKLIPVLYQQSVAPGGNPDLTTFLLHNALSSPNAIRLTPSMSFLDFGPTFHFSPRKILDPYIGLGVGIGTCSGDCLAARAYAKAGLRLNMGGGFIFAEAEQSVIKTKEQGEISSPLIDKLGIFGFGLYL